MNPNRMSERPEGRQARPLRFYITAVSIAIVVLLLLTAGFLFVLSLDQQYANGNGDSFWSRFQKRTVELADGNTYQERKDITTVLLIGIDSEGEIKGSGSYKNGSISDFLLLLVFDHKDQTISALQINRDTMTNVIKLGVTGQRAGREYAQIGYAYMYGDGLEDSCINTVNTVSEFLYGAEIDYYFTTNMTSIPIINDHFGGVSVTADRDYSEIISELTEGETVQLTGEQAYDFIRDRMGLSDGTNTYRMSRQKVYLNALVDRVVSSRVSSGDLLDLSEKIAPYSLTDCTSKYVSEIAEYLLSYEFLGIVTPEGESVIGDADPASGKQHMEFYVDEADLTKRLVGLIYEPSKS